MPIFKGDRGFNIFKRNKGQEINAEWKNQFLNNLKRELESTVGDYNHVNNGAREYGIMKVKIMEKGGKNHLSIWVDSSSVENGVVMKVSFTEKDAICVEYPLHKGGSTETPALPGMNIHDFAQKLRSGIKNFVPRHA